MTVSKTLLFAGLAISLPALAQNDDKCSQPSGTFFSSTSASCESLSEEPEANTFFDETRDRLSYDAAVGEGETLDALMSLWRVQGHDKHAFASLIKANFSALFGDPTRSGRDISNTLKSLMAQDPQLNHYIAGSKS